jgi:hypothetical protein
MKVNVPLLTRHQTTRIVKLLLAAMPLQLLHLHRDLNKAPRYSVLTPNRLLWMNPGNKLNNVVNALRSNHLHRVLALLSLSLHHATPRNLQQHDLLSLANVARSQQLSHPVLRRSPLLLHLDHVVENRPDS